LEQIIKEHIFPVLHGACLIYKTNGCAVSFHASMSVKINKALQFTNLELLALLS